MEVYTDGSCITGPNGDKFSGGGIWFGPDDKRNTSIPIDVIRSTNQHAELISILYALRFCKDLKFITIKTDSKYSIDCITVWHAQWHSNGWKTSTGSDVLHSDIIKECRTILDYRSKMKYTTSIEYVKGHSNHQGNDGADRLARLGAEASIKAFLSETIFFDNSPLSQFWTCMFTSSDEDGNIQYNCVEQWHHHQKALLFNDIETAAKILLVNTPFLAYKLGRQVKNFNEDLWSQKRSQLAIKGNFYKFSQNPSLKKYLQSTKPKMLVEARDDKVWGIGITIADAKAGIKWNGLNLLGRTLMVIRDTML